MSSRLPQTAPHTTGRPPAADPTAEAAGPTPVPVTAATPTAAQVASSVPAAPAPADALEAPTFQLSFKQLLAGAAAAITAAVLGSRLGVAGTLIGAGLASSVSMIAAAVYSHSLATAAYKVKLARAHSDVVTLTQPIATAHQAWGELPTVAIAPVARAAAPTSPRGWRSRWVAAGLGVVAACAIALLAVTGIEAVRGTPLSGGTAGGLSVLGGAPVGTADTPVTGRTSVVTTDPGTEPAAPLAPTSADPTSADPTTDAGPAATTSTTVTSTVTITPVVPPTSAEPTTQAPSTPSAPTTADTGAATTAAPTTTADPTTAAAATAVVPPANERATTTTR